MFDLSKHEFILDPAEVAVARLVRTGNLSFNLISPDETLFATLKLPGPHPETYEFVNFTTIEPYHAPAKLILEEGAESAERKKEPGDGQHGENTGAYALVNKARVTVNRKYNEIIEQDSTYREVYNKWSDLMESMSDYLVDVTYGKPYYSMQPIQFNHDIRQWYETMLPEVGTDKEILFGDMLYTSPLESSVTSEEIESFFYALKPAKPGGYNRMWNEIMPAFLDWKWAREKYAKALEPHKRLSYDQHTHYLTDYLFKEIKGLLISRNDEADQ